jgi:hypothetical protein
MQEASESPRSSSIFPFDPVESILKRSSFFKVPDPEVNIVFEVCDDTNSPKQKYLLEFTEDGIRIYKEDGVSYSLTTPFLMHSSLMLTLN